MSILDTAARRLTSGGYNVVSGGDEVRFEDASVLGFAVEFPTIERLLSGWQEAQDRFLRSCAGALRRDRRKAWNVYSIFLTAEHASIEAVRALVSVEENFESTRKIARSGVVTERDIESAMAVLLPMPGIATRVELMTIPTTMSRKARQWSMLNRPSIAASIMP